MWPEFDKPQSLGRCVEVCTEDGLCTEHAICSVSCVENLWTADTYGCHDDLDATIECLAQNSCDEGRVCTSRGQPWLPCFDRLVEDSIDSFPFELEFTRCALIWDRVHACDGSLTWDDAGFACDNDVTAATTSFECMPSLIDWLECMERRDPCEALQICEGERESFESCVGYN